MIFVFSIIDGMYHTDWFAGIEPPLYPGNKSHLIVVNDFFLMFIYLCILNFFFFFKFIYFERERACAGGAERENPKQAPHSQCEEPNAGL